MFVLLIDDPGIREPSSSPSFPQLCIVRYHLVIGPLTIILDLFDFSFSTDKGPEDQGSFIYTGGINLQEEAKRNMKLQHCHYLLRKRTLQENLKHDLALLHLRQRWPLSCSHQVHLEDETSSDGEDVEMTRRNEQSSCIEGRTTLGAEAPEVWSRPLGQE
jgi:hypothetical protein